MRTFKEHILIEQHEITVGGYTTKYFYISSTGRKNKKHIKGTFNH